MPIAGYIDFDACITGMQDKHDKETAQKVCGAKDIEKSADTPSVATGYLNILKEEYGNEARLFVGKLSVDSVDKEGDQITIDAFKKVMPTFMRRGVLIDSHSNKVIGRPLKYWIDDNAGSTIVGWQIYDDYHIDDEVWQKIRNGTYEGMSIGGFAVPGEQETVCDHAGCKVIINKIELWEGSAVKRGANSDALILAHNEFAKSDATISEITVMPDDSGLISENTMTDNIKKPKPAVDTGSVETVDTATPAGDVKKQDDVPVEEPVEGDVPEETGATVEEKLDAVIELLQNAVGRIEALEDMTGPATPMEEEKMVEEEPTEDEENDVEKSALAVANKAIDQITQAMPGIINKSLKNAGIIHAPRPVLKAEGGKPLTKADDNIVTMDSIKNMSFNDVNAAGDKFAEAVRRGGQ